MIAWLCRVCAFGSAIVTMVGFLYWYTLDPDGFDRSVAFGPAAILVVTVGAFGFWEVLGRVLSWTSPWRPLPRFDDAPGDDAREWD